MINNMCKGKIILGKDRFGREISRELDSVDSMTNNNVVVVGSSGSGKSTSVFVPNIVQEGQNIVVSDPKGSLLRQYGTYLESMYDIRILNIKDFCRSMHYNPLAYCENERDVVMLANIICSHTVNGKARRTSDDYWTESARNLLIALMTYILSHEIDGNMNEVLELINKEKTYEKYDDRVESPLDFCMKCDGDRNSEFITECYSTYQQAANVTRASILTSLLQMLSIFMVGEVKECMRYDELNLRDFFEDYFYYETKKRVALFVIQDDVDETKNLFATIIYAQLFKMACTRADMRRDSRLMVPLRFFLDDFATAGLVPNFSHLISNIRSRNISVMIAVQNESQLFSIYGDDAKTIIGNCNYYIYMGSTDIFCRREISERFDIPLKKLAFLDRKKCLVDTGDGYQELYKYYDKNLMERIKCDVYSMKLIDEPLYENMQLSFIRSKNAEEIERLNQRQRRMLERRRALANNRIGQMKTVDKELDSINSDIKELESSLEEAAAEFELDNVPQIIIDAESIRKEISTMDMRSSIFDSQAEEKLYKKLVEYFKEVDSIDIKVHMRLSEIFTDSNTRKRGKEKYRLTNMHCDFVLMNKYKQMIYMAIEVDGPFHEDPVQAKLDLLKNLLFEEKDIILYRIKADDVDGDLPDDLTTILDAICMDINCITG